MKTLPYSSNEIAKAREERLWLRGKNGYDFQVGRGGKLFTFWVGYMILKFNAPSLKAAIDGLAKMFLPYDLELVSVETEH